jgi:predicted phosphodiesterase
MSRVLSNEQLTSLAALPAQGRAHDIELWHGSAQDPITGWISSPQDAADHLARQQARIGLVGHTHRPLIAENNGRTIQYDEHPGSHDLADDRRAVLNPGSCSNHADGSNSTSHRETRSGTRPDLSVNPGAA